jgi:O-antigen ligase
MVVVVDGYSRDINDFEENPPEGFEYVPYYGAFVLAGLALPLTLIYARQQKATQSEGLLLWLLFCTTAYTKDFAYMHVPGLPIYVTDVVLAILLLSIGWKKLKLLRLWKTFVGAAWMGFVIAGVFTLARSVHAGNDTKVVARDFAIIVYTAFMIVTGYVARDWQTIRRILLFGAAGATLSAVGGLTWFMAQPDQRRLILYGVYVLLALAGVVIAIVYRIIKPVTGWPIAFMLLIGLVLANARTLDVALGVVLLVFGVTSLGGGLKFSASKILKTAMGLVFLVFFAVWVTYQTNAGQQFIDRVAEEFVSGVFHSGDDANSQFRFLAWAEAFGRFLAEPITGEGFGLPFIFEQSQGLDPRPHNTFLTILYKMGLLGFIPFSLFLSSLFVKGWQGFQAARRNPNAPYLHLLLLVLFGMCLYGGLNLLLESPFLAVGFWVLVGLIIRSWELLKEGTTSQYDTMFPQGPGPKRLVS